MGPVTKLIVRPGPQRFNDDVGYLPDLVKPGPACAPRPNSIGSIPPRCWRPGDRVAIEDREARVDRIDPDLAVVILDDGRVLHPGQPPAVAGPLPPGTLPLWDDEPRDGA